MCACGGGRVLLGLVLVWPRLGLGRGLGLLWLGVGVRGVKRWGCGLLLLLLWPLLLLTVGGGVVGRRGAACAGGMGLLRLRARAAAVFFGSRSGRC